MIFYSHFDITRGYIPKNKATARTKRRRRAGATSAAAVVPRWRGTAMEKCWKSKGTPMENHGHLPSGKRIMMDIDG